MKLKVLSVGRSLDHTCVEEASFEQAKVFTDYDAVIIDPEAVRGLWSEVMPREDKSLFSDLAMYGGLGRWLIALIEQRMEECIHLLATGGLIVCYLRPLGEVLTIRKPLSGGRFQDYQYSVYAWLPQWHGILVDLVRAARGSNVLISDAKQHPFSQFIRAYNNDPEFGFQAYTDRYSDFTPIAENRGGQIVAFDASFRGGHVVFLPAFDSSDSRKEAGILVNCVRNMLTSPRMTEPPVWVVNYPVPGEGGHASEIARLDDEIRRLQKEMHSLQQQENELAGLRCLLYEQGKFQLEPVVRRAFRLLGFEVPEFDEYQEDWDVLLGSPEGDSVAEVEGRDDDAVNRDKFRQLLDYQVEWVGRGLDYKGVLVINGYRLIDPNDRRVQITDAALRGCVKQGFCVLPTTELFKAVCAALQQPDNNEELKGQIRLSILQTVGLYTFDEALTSAQSSTNTNGVTV